MALGSNNGYHPGWNGLRVVGDPGNVGTATAPAGATVDLSGESGGSRVVLGSQTVASAIPAGSYGTSLVFDVAVPGSVDRLLVRIVPDGPECDDSNETVVEGPFCE